MIDHVAARDRLKTLIEAAVPDGTTVYASGLQPLADFPAVVIGMPSWSVDTSSYHTDQTTYPIAVILARPGEQDPITVDVIEDIWQRVTQALRTASEVDQTLGDVCLASAIQRSQFGQFNVQTQEYPSQVIFVDLFG